MAEAYRTVKAYAQDQFVEKKSRFIGAVVPCRTEQEALDFIAQKKKEYWDASHNVYAYILRDSGIKRCSDDGEPQGTAGRPVLDVLEKENLTDLCVVATRYFGGVMLGAGGLVRAYSHTSKIAVDAAEIMNMHPCKRLRLVFEYPFYGQMTYLLPQYPHVLIHSDFGEHVVMELLLRSDHETAFCKELSEMTNGQLSPEFLAEEMADISL